MPKIEAIGCLEELLSVADRCPIVIAKVRDDRDIESVLDTYVSFVVHGYDTDSYGSYNKYITAPTVSHRLSVQCALVQFGGTNYFPNSSVIFIVIRMPDDEPTTIVENEWYLTTLSNVANLLTNKESTLQFAPLYKNLIAESVASITDSYPEEQKGILLIDIDITDDDFFYIGKIFGYFQQRLYVTTFREMCEYDE